MACQIISLGATLTHLWVPDSKNGTRDVVLGFDDLTAYRTKYDPYFGASVGRTANRIAQGQFSLPHNPNVIYKLDQNNGPNSLHGGIDGFSFRNWDVDLPAESDKGEHRGTTLRLSLTSDHMDQGFPGKIHVQCTYRLVNSSLEIVYEAQLAGNANDDNQQMTIASLTNHAYFNLNGVPTPEAVNEISTSLVTNHVVEMFNVDSYLETDSTSVPTGTILPLDVASVMDFRVPKTFGDHITQTPGGGHGYDHFYPVQAAINSPQDYHLTQDIHRVAPIALIKVHSPESGIHMTMATTEPGFQLYTANFVQLDPDQVDMNPDNSKDTTDHFRRVGKARGGYRPHSAFCLEASKFPDAINHPAWRDQVILRHGFKYQSKTTYAFTAK
ncbi:galactose mutarotase-like domain-containing protein [Gamsiella multidivaricata]|uniref:galactose mutarotase-like domain-containing protein n=1 Tax=Gamsiella multidivaricata TaxID=101098 RepID=UPI002221260E|nr:galactose mutarotase-like domain-containing protein [Gamsiella multidivaricata]KAI7830505.1 galactose mutarotase-like domain-containing protein [Gamsiella multidivaricata]